MPNLHPYLSKAPMLLIVTLSLIISCTQDDFLNNDFEKNGLSDGTTSIEDTTNSELISDAFDANSELTNNLSNETFNCGTQGGLAHDTGLKVWCWGDITLPDYSGSKGVSFSNRELVIDSECYERQITNTGTELKFSVNPTTPEVKDWCSRDFNMRAEIRTAPWQVKNPLGTEEWFGWRYRFGDNYIIDQNSQWKFFQVYPGPTGLSAQISLEVINKDQFEGHSAGEIYVINNADPDKYNPTGIIACPGDALDIVVHVIWDDSSKGLLQVWINNREVYNKQVATVSPEQPWGGNAKWGIYKWPWADASKVQKSIDQSISNLETYLGTLRMITRNEEDPEYGKDSYKLVVPR